MAETRRRRWPKVLGVCAGVLVVGAIWVNAQLEPSRLAATVLGQAGKSLRLKLSFQGKPDYAFRPEPRLVLPGFKAAELDGRVFLSARRAEISLPWSTLTGGDPVITRVELQAPQFELPVFQHWLASRPPAPFKLPTLERGIDVSDARVNGEDWSLRGLSLSLPHLRSGDPAKLQSRGTLQAGDMQLPFELDADVATPGLASDVAVKLKLLLEQAGEKGKPATPAPVAIAMDSHYEWADPKLSVDARKLAVVGNAFVPSFEGKAQVQLVEASASLGVDAVLSRWPSTWPQLPAALARQSERLPVQIHYAGKRDFSDTLTLAAARADTSLEASLKWPELRQWLAASPASPLPPLSGKLKTPALDFEGVQLEGVEVEIGEGGGEATAP